MSASLLDITMDNDLFRQVLKQFKKDAGLAGIKSFPVYLNKENFMEKISAWINEVLLHPSSFSRLIYQVDIPESKLKEILNSSDDKVNLLTQLLLKRILQKVIIRNQFSSNSH